MSARSRIVALVGFAALVAVGIVGVAVVSTGDSARSTAATEVEPRPGRPPLVFALGFRADREARDLVRGRTLYEDGKPRAAEALFARHESLEARVGVAFASWPDGTLDRLEQLGKLYPETGVVQIHLGLARLWSREGDPLAPWNAVLEDEPDTPYAVLAGNLLFPKLPRGLPTFVPSFSAPAAVTELPSSEQLAALRRRADRGGAREQLLYGVGLQRVGMPVSAAKAFERAARLAPGDVEARVATAVGRFDKRQPEVAFGRLGPLARSFPREPTVRFHLGVLLLWTGRIEAAERQFRLASRTRPGSPLAREAARYLRTVREAQRSKG